MALQAEVTQRSWVGGNISIGDPALAEFYGLGGYNDAGVNVTEKSALGFTALYRAVEIIAGTIGTLPLKTFKDSTHLQPDGTPERSRTSSFLDDPGAGVLTPFEWKHLIFTHLLLHGNAYLLHVYNAAGAIVGLFPIQPSMVAVRYGTLKGVPDMAQTRIYEVTVAGMPAVEYTSDDMTHIMGLSLDGIKGLSVIEIMRNPIGTGIAGDKAAAKLFSNGLMLGGIVTSDEDLTPEQADAIKSGLRAKMAGTDNAGGIAIVNASLKFSPWTMNSQDAQFLESREHQVEEISRITGVPAYLLGQVDKQTSWGTGVAEQNRGLARYTLSRWTCALEERLSLLLSNKQFVEFDYAGLIQSAPEIEIPLLIQQVEAGLLTLDEARAIRNLPPLTVPAPPFVPVVGPVPIKVIKGVDE